MQNEKDMDAFVDIITGFDSFENIQFLSYAEKKALENYREWVRLTKLLIQHEDNFKKYYRAYQLAGGKHIREIEQHIELPAPEPMQLPEPEPDRRRTSKRFGISLDDFVGFYKSIRKELGEYPADGTLADYFQCDKTTINKWRKKAIGLGMLETTKYIRNREGFVDRILERFGPPRLQRG